MKRMQTAERGFLRVVYDDTGVTYKQDMKKHQKKLTEDLEKKTDVRA
jgi:hypothetical protein